MSAPFSSAVSHRLLETHQGHSLESLYSVLSDPVFAVSDGSFSGSNSRAGLRNFVDEAYWVRLRSHSTAKALTSEYSTPLCGSCDISAPLELKRLR